MLPAKNVGRNVYAFQGAYQAAHYSSDRSPTEGTQERAGTRQSVLFQPQLRRSPPKVDPAEPPWRLPRTLRPQSYRWLPPPGMVNTHNTSPDNNNSGVG